MSIEDRNLETGMTVMTFESEEQYKTFLKFLPKNSFYLAGLPNKKGVRIVNVTLNEKEYSKLKLNFQQVGYTVTHKKWN